MPLRSAAGAALLPAAEGAVCRACEGCAVSARQREAERPLQTRLTRRAMLAVHNRRVFPYLVAVTAATAVVTGLIAHLVDRKDFPTFGVGVWWAVVTLGTVGYGDVVPHTAWGRVLGSAVIICGVTFLSFLIAIVTSLFIDTDRVHEKSERDARHEELTALLRTLDERLAALEKHVGPRP
jgi:voltage-gated potassium channel Kch